MAFLKDNFDNILDSENNQIYQMYPYFNYPELELNEGQESKLSDFFKSSDVIKREFAIFFTRNISDIDLLRESYASLKGNKYYRTIILEIQK